MFNPNNIEDLQFSTERQILDRKSARIRAIDLAPFLLLQWQMQTEDFWLLALKTMVQSPE